MQKLGKRAHTLELPTPVVARSEPPFSVVIRMDGSMARERGRDWGAGARKTDPQRVDWKAIKSAVIQSPGPYIRGPF